MGVQYGLNFTASDAKDYLEKNSRQNNGVKTWQQLFGSTSLSATAQSDALKENYANAIAQAYASNLANKNSIYRSGLTAGSQNQLLSDSNNAMNSAYAQYMAQYAEDVNTLQTNYDKAITAVNNQLNTEAENYSKLLNKTYDYIKDELQYSTYRGINNEFANMFVTKDEVDKGKYDKAMEGQLKDWETIAREYNVVDDQGNLSTGAQEFFDMVFNAAPQATLYTSDKGDTHYTRSFDEWLSDKDNDLRTWWQSADQYNYTKAGTKAGSIKQAVGLESDDSKYHMSEYVSGSDDRFAYKRLGEGESVADNYTANEEKFKTVFGSNAMTDEVANEFKKAKETYDTDSVEPKISDYITDEKLNDIIQEVGSDSKYSKYLAYGKHSYLKKGYYSIRIGKEDELLRKLLEDGYFTDEKTKYDSAMNVYNNARSNYDKAIKKIFETQASKSTNKK